MQLKVFCLLQGVDSFDVLVLHIHWGGGGMGVCLLSTCVFLGQTIQGIWRYYGDIFHEGFNAWYGDFLGWQA